MPRENQKRGRAKRRRETEIVKAPAPVVQARLPSPVAPEGAVEDLPTGGSDWPLLDAETRAYFKQIEQKIIDLERLGVGQTKKAGEQLDDADERVLLIRGSLASLRGHEVELATDPEASFVLERLLYSMDDFAKRVMADQFIGQYAQLARNGFASHVLQTLIYLGSFAVEREMDGNFASGPTTSTQELRTMTELLCIACSELLPDIASHLYDKHSTHVLRSALLLVSGSPFPTDQNQEGLRSKKSRNFKSRQAPLRSLLGEEIQGKGKERERAIPADFRELKAQLLEALDLALGKGTDGQLARQAGADPVAGVVVQLVLGFEADAGGSEAPGSLLDRLLEGLVTQSAERGSAKSATRTDYIETVLRDSSSSHLLEAIISCSPQGIFDELWSIYYNGRLDKLAVHPVANFTVAKAISRLQPDLLRVATLELRASSAPKTMIETSRTGPLKALAEGAAVLGGGTAEVAQVLLSALKAGDAGHHRHLVMAILTLTPCDILLLTPTFRDFTATPEITLQGSLLAQAWLRMPSPASDSLLESLLTVPVEYLQTLCCDPMASRMIDAVFYSPAVAGKFKRRFIMRLLKRYHILADDRIGSRIAERCWDHADPFLKEKIAKSLLPHIVQLSGAKVGHFFARKIQLPLYERKPGDWKAKVAAMPKPDFDGVQKLAKRDVPGREIDDIFNGSMVKKRKVA